MKERKGLFDYKEEEEEEGETLSVNEYGGGAQESSLAGDGERLGEGLLRSIAHFTLPSSQHEWKWWWWWLLLLWKDFTIIIIMSQR